MEGQVSLFSSQQKSFPLTETTSSKLDFNRIAPIFFLVLVDILGLTLILPLLHLYAAAYGASPLQIGLVAATFPLAQLIGVPIMGALSDKFGRKPLLLISQVSTCISFFMLAFANSLEMIILSRIVDGIFGANLSTAQAALADMTDDENRARGLGLIGAAFGLGFILGPIMSIVALEVSNSLAVPAFIAAVYSFISILLTLFMFKESLPPEKRGMKSLNPLPMFSYLVNPKVNGLLLLMFAQQLIFFGFESLLGLFLLSRLGLLGQGTGIIFLIVGIVLVTVQVRFIGKWTRKYGEGKVVLAALAFLAIGLLLTALTPEQPQPFYVKALVEYDLQHQAPNSTEAILGDLNVSLPEEANRGFFGVLWIWIVVIPLSVGAGVMRPSLNSLMTKRVNKEEYGSILGVSASFGSAANAAAPLLGGYLFQHYGTGMPFLLGAGLMGLLFLLSFTMLKRA
jgi:MFS family permease